MADEHPTETHLNLTEPQSPHSQNSMRPEENPPARGVEMPLLDTSLNERRTGDRSNSDAPICPHPLVAGHTTTARTAYEVMRKWGLKFSGTRSEDPESFLARIEEGRAIVPVSDTDALRCLPLFLHGVALFWFRTNRSRWLSWAEFEAAWRRRFGDADFQFTLEQDIIRRTQGQHEPVADFLTCFQGMLERLVPPWPREKQLRYAHRNLLPRLRFAIHREDFYDFEGLSLAASRAEKAWDTPYVPPPKPETTVLPELAYRPPKKGIENVPTTACAAWRLDKDYRR